MYMNLAASQSPIHSQPASRWSRPVATAALALLASASPLAITPALADGTPQAEAAPAEIIVTATKRSESVQKVPISITALGGADLERHQVTSFEDYAKMMPSVSFQSFGPSQSQMYFRGIATGGDGIALGPLPAVGFYIDETPVTTIYGSVDMHVYDMNRIEALSGPQGTLYGASSLSGTLRMITNQPKLGKWEGGIDAEVNKFGKGNAGGKLEGFLNIPISDQMAARIVGFYQHDGGYIDNVPYCRTYNRGATVPFANLATGSNPITVCNDKSVAKAGDLVDQHAGNNQNDVTSAGGRAALKINLDDNWTATPTVMYQHQIAHGTFLYGPEVNGAGDLQVHDFTPERNRDDWYLAALTIQGKLSNWDVTYAGSYFDRRVDTMADYSYFSVTYDNLYSDYTDFATSGGAAIDPTQIYHSHDHYTKLSQELRISSPPAEKLRLTAGLFLQHQTDAHVADYIIPGFGDNALNQPSGDATAIATLKNYNNFFYPFAIPGAPADDVFYTNINRIDRDYAAFAEASYDILPSLTLTAGIRGFIARNTLTGFSGSFDGLQKAAEVQGCTTLSITACPNVNARYKESGETHKISLKWQIDPTKMVYFTYSTGFRPGGNNRIAFFGGHDLQNPGPFTADTLANYELGWKTSWLNHKLRFNGAIFWEDWNNIQYATPGVQGIFMTVNAGTARSQGIEADLSYKFTPKFTVSASGTYVNPRLTSDFTCTNKDKGCGYDAALQTSIPYGYLYAPAGTRLPVTPRVKLNATARYETLIGAYNAYLQGSLAYQSDISTNLRTGWQAITGNLPGFATVDFGAGVSRDAWKLDMFITNAFDKRGLLGINQSCSASPCLSDVKLLPTKPQQFGMRVGYTF